MFGSKKRFKVLAAIPKKDGTTWWMNCGTMYDGKTPGSFNLYIDAMPTHAPKDGGPQMFHLREFTEDDMRESRERAERRNGNSHSGASSYSARGTLARTDANGSPMLGADLPLFEPPSRSHEANEQPPF
jgi:hypothetical protein